MTDLHTAVARVKHLSASAIADYLECPLRWYGRRVAKWDEPASPALAMGSALHAAIAAHHRGEDGELALLTAWREVRPMDPPAGALERHLDAINQYVACVEPTEGDATEFFFRAHLPGVPVPLIGFVDLLRPDSSLWEFKSGASKWDQQKIDLQLQATAYWALHTLEVGAPPSRVVFVALQTGPYRPVEVTMLETSRTDAQVETFAETCRTVYDGMQRCLSGDMALRPKCKAGRCAFPEQCAGYAP